KGSIAAAYYRLLYVLNPADLREAVDHRDNHRPHLSRADEPIQLCLQILPQRIDGEERLPCAGVADDRVRRRIATVRIVLRREVDGNVPLRWISKRVALQHLRIERLADHLAARHVASGRQPWWTA